MRIAVSIESNGGMEAPVCAHFGHAPYFALVNVQGQQVTEVQVVPNPHYPQHEPGAIPQFIQGQGAHVMLTGGMGARAVAFFQQAGIEPVTGAGGTVRQAVAQYLSGQLTGTAPCHESVAGCDGEHEHHGENR